MEQESLENYEFKDFIAKGAFGSVFLAQRRSDKKLCAIKVFEKSKVANTQKIYEEARILASLDHPNIVKFEEILSNNKKLYIVMEYFSGGNLCNLIRDYRKANKKLTDEDQSKIIKHITSAVMYLHKQGIIHRDIKLENVVLEDKNNLRSVKLIDFGLSAQFTYENKTFNKNCGTLLYLAPELFKYNIYTKAVDVWACGILLYMVCNEGRHPFFKKGDDKEELLSKIISPPKEVSENLRDLPRTLYSKMTTVEPSERYTIEQVCNHPWLTRNFNSTVPLTSAESFIAFQQQGGLLRVMKALMFLSFCEGQKTKKLIKKRTGEKSNGCSFFLDNEDEVKSVEDPEEPFKTFGFDSVSDFKKSTDYTSSYSQKNFNCVNRLSDNNSGEYLSKNNSIHQDALYESNEKYRRTATIRNKNEKDDGQKKKEFRISPLKKVSTFGPVTTTDASPPKKLHSKRTLDLPSNSCLEKLVLNQEENISPERTLILPKINNPRSPKKGNSQLSVSSTKVPVMPTNSSIFNLTAGSSGFGALNTAQNSISLNTQTPLLSGKIGINELSPLRKKKKQLSTYDKKIYINLEENSEVPSVECMNETASRTNGFYRSENVGIQNNNIIDLQLYLKNLGIKVGSKNYSNVSERQKSYYKPQDSGPGSLKASLKLE